MSKLSDLRATFIRDAVTNKSEKVNVVVVAVKLIRGAIETIVNRMSECKHEYKKLYVIMNGSDIYLAPQKVWFYYKHCLNIVKKEIST